MKRKISYCTALVLCALFILSACGRNTQPERLTPEEFFAGLEAGLSNETQQPAQAEDEAYTPLPAVRWRDGGTLTVLAPVQFRPILEQAALLMQDERHFELELTTYDPEYDAIYWAHRLQNMFAEGESFDIIFADPIFPMWDFARAGNLTEINGLINRCIYFNRSDFFEEALEALTINNELYFFPLGFGFQYVSINTFLPQYFIDRFLQYETITVSQMIDIYTDIVVADLDIWGPWPGINSMARCRDMSVPGFMAWNAINDFVDIGSGTSNLLDGEFLSFLEQMLRVFPMPEGMIDEWDARNNLRNNTIGRGVTSFWNGSPTNMRDWYMNYVFQVKNEFLFPIGGIVPYTEPTEFVGFVPLVDRQGRRKSSMGVTFPWKILSIPQGDNDLLAWDFVTQHLVPASLCERTNRRSALIRVIPGIAPVRVNVYTNLGVRTFDSPIIQDLSEAHFTDVFERTLTRTWRAIVSEERTPGFLRVTSMTVEGLPLEGILDATYAEREQNIANAIERIKAINNTPMSPVPLVPFHLFEPSIHQMLRRIISTDVAQEQIHEAVSQWLLEQE